MDTKGKIKVMQHFLDGGEVEWRFGSGWDVITSPTWDWTRCAYRIKPEPEYVPYTAEDIDKMEDRVVAYKDGSRYPITGWHRQKIRVDGLWFAFDLVLKTYTHLDGTPFGKLKEN